MIPTTWAGVALVPLFSAISVNALIFELPSHSKRQHEHHHHHRPSTRKLAKRAPVLPADWVYAGCYSDGPARTLTGGYFQDDAMTIEKCVNYCVTNNFQIAATEYGRECYCDNAVRNGGAPATEGCNMLCNGDNTETCGGGYRLSLYNGPNAVMGPPTPLASYNTWGYQGCYMDNVNGRALAVGMAYTAPLTPQKCMNACQAQGYEWAGLEYSTECYCGAGIINGGALALDAATCDMPCAGAPGYLCGGGNRLTVYRYGAAPVSNTGTSTTAAATTTTTTSTTAAATTTTTTSAAATTSAAGTQGWNSLGCHTDSIASRTLPNGIAINGALTIEKCQEACRAANYVYAGVEYAGECYCANTINGGVPVNDGRCNMPCNGNTAQMCGGANGIFIYQYGTVNGGASSTAPPSSTSAPATTSTSATATTSAGPGTNPVPEGVLATYGGWTYSDCYVDSVATRSMPLLMPLAGGVAQVTVEKCLDACHGAGYTWAGLEYSQECYCSNAAPLQIATDGRCSMRCNGNQAQVCGGGNGLTVYSYSNTQTTSAPPSSTSVPATSSTPATSSVPVTSSTVPTTSSTVPPTSSTMPPTTVATTTTATVSSATPTGLQPLTNGLPTGWSYSGCWVDNAHGGRIQPLQAQLSSPASALVCIDACTSLGYTVAGIEYAAECYCSNSLNNGAALATDPSTCDMRCAGDNAHACGGANRVTVYSSLTTIPVYAPPQAVTTNLPGEWEYRGCYSDPAGGQTRALAFLSSGIEGEMSVPKCLEHCAKFGQTTGGLQFGQECWCGEFADIPSRGGAVAPEAQCSSPCVGAPDQICGAPERLSVYTWNMNTGNPLYVWNQPANTGHYELLIGGIVIPLITTLGINNKMYFLEKFGTGAPNSTGAYELDYINANDYTKAWREMHVTSDVFCAAGLVLPDRTGRHLSVGGWSLESTYGLRFMTPSGTPGVNGTSDWEENYEELHLQQSRWYPGAMQMANGSILIVGGEQGSNGAPTPTLEVLPKPAGGPTYLYMDWLQNSDPYNLYPYLFVLPHGDILTVYYDEARILDEVTFATKKILPNLPSSVVGKGGRTYPLEGTAMILPQHAPYTEPFEVLVCGGSAFGIALDNCVSTQPEAANPEWIIERMPSPRVLTNMAPLPDGTYLILGGAHAGVAGFGLASDPNLSAVLYDPSKPHHQRFSILGNTSVARLYHSEASILHDGRVMVTGSDPQDETHPQEYRMEVYVPPYLTDGRIQPEYTIAERDWVYGQTYDIQVTTHNGGGSPIRVSLLGAVSSTHGASFGQRTIFPAVDCPSGTCHITAPPDAHTCPPGWYMLFVLDGPTPSHSQWVRIGGDPAELGNWPPFEDFTKPGVGHI